ncbi:MAG: hypothetical protein H6Q90_5767 [Deltaproteobacteria bacterium]|nr:hypothetical protein [Deltaproteobacteria bacterium]
MRPARVVTLAALAALSGCAGAFSGYGPGMTNEQRTSHGVTPDSPGSSMGTYSSRSYKTGEHVLGAQLGARLGAASASAGSLASGTALAVDAHADVVYAMDRWGVGIATGYTSDRLGEHAGATYFYSGFPVTAYGQFGLTRRIFVHGGAGRVIYGSVKRIEPNETSVDASAWRASAGITFVFVRGAKKDFALRLEGRVQRSGEAMLDGQDARWSSSAVLGELIYASF